MKEIIVNQLNEASRVLNAFVSDERSINSIERAAGMMAFSIENGGKIMTCGNGGSNCDAMHFAEELTGKFRKDRRALPAMAMSDTSHITCVGNDYGFEHIFSRYVEGLGRPGDVLLGISTSGNSPNVINAALAAKKKKMKVVVLTGKNGGKLAEIADIEIRVPHMGFSDRIQEIHIKIIHILIYLIEQKVKM
ncbi:MAG: D-sedoheptulose 7-phosphate isomerase [Cytophagales bacterium]|nr:D-sedoheptulose 7-phosphate isomerase [Cytophagales bacterium]